MQALFLLAGLIVLLSIAVFFSSEFGAFFKKVFEIPGMILVLPLTGASAIVVSYDYALWYVLEKLQHAFTIISERLAHLLPGGEASMPISQIISLFMLSCVPVWIMLVRAKFKKIPEPQSNPYLVSAFFWALGMVFLVVYQQ